MILRKSSFNQLTGTPTHRLAPTPLSGTPTSAPVITTLQPTVFANIATPLFTGTGTGSAVDKALRRATPPSATPSEIPVRRVIEYSVLNTPSLAEVQWLIQHVDANPTEALKYSALGARHS